MVHRVEIGKVQVRGALAEWHSIRLSVPSLMARANLVPPGLPPQGILIVRHMTDPQPGKFAKSLSPMQLSHGWEHNARRQMAVFYRHAANPARDPLTTNAEAVLFHDETELLACLLRDLAQRTALQRWWWQSVLRSGSLGRKPSSQGEVVEAVTRQMIQKAHLVPGILTHLEAWGQAVSVVHILSAEQAGQVLQAVLQAYRLPKLPEGIAPGPPHLPPWSPGRINQTGGRERTALLGVCLDLQARPQQVRAARYQEQLQAWWRTAGSKDIIRQEEVDSPVVVSEGQPVTPSTVRLHDHPEVSLEHEPRVQPETSFAAENVASDLGDRQTQPARNERKLQYSTTENAIGQQRSVRFVNDESGTQTAHRGMRSRLSESQTESISPANVENQVPVMQPESESPSSVLQPEIFAWLSSGVPTRLGGVLYLINLMTHLDLPGCFEEDWHLASRLGPWGLLEVLARALLGEAIERFEDDPLWRALAHLDGRDPDEPPGLLMSRSRPRRWPKFRVPEPWLRGLPPDAVRLSRTRYGSKHSRNISDSPWLQRWLDLALPFITYRLRLALRLPEEAGLAESLLIMPGRIYVTSSHVDLAASVEQISLPVRLAGLDRDPGWMPEFGRVIYFHFLE